MDRGNGTRRIRGNKKLRIRGTIGKFLYAPFSYLIKSLSGFWLMNAMVCFFNGSGASRSSSISCGVLLLFVFSHRSLSLLSIAFFFRSGSFFSIVRTTGSWRCFVFVFFPFSVVIDIAMHTYGWEGGRVMWHNSIEHSMWRNGQIKTLLNRICFAITELVFSLDYLSQGINGVCCIPFHTPDSRKLQNTPVP